MKLKQIKKQYFQDNFKKMAEAGGIGVQTLRNFLSADREAKKLDDGNFILTSKKTIEFKVDNDGETH